MARIGKRPACDPSQLHPAKAGGAGLRTPAASHRRPSSEARDLGGSGLLLAPLGDPKASFLLSLRGFGELWAFLGDLGRRFGSLWRPLGGFGGLWAALGKLWGSFGLPLGRLGGHFGCLWVLWG